MIQPQSKHWLSLDYEELHLQLISIHKIIHRKRKKEKHSSLGRWCHWILKCFSVSRKEENWHKKYVVLCYPVLYISWNPRCRVQEKSSLREKVRLQHLRSGKTISWNGRKEMRSKLFPLFFPFLSIIWEKNGVGGVPYSPLSVIVLRRKPR